MEKDYKEASRRINEAYKKENEHLKKEVLGSVKEDSTSPQNRETQIEKASDEN